MTEITRHDWIAGVKFLLSELHQVKASLEFLAQFGPTGAAAANLDATISNLQGRGESQSEVTPSLTEVLEQHQLTDTPTWACERVCSCGENVHTLIRHRGHAAHVADALQASFVVVPKPATVTLECCGCGKPFTVVNNKWTAHLFCPPCIVEGRGNV